MGLAYMLLRLTVDIMKTIRVGFGVLLVIAAAFNTVVAQESASNESLVKLASNLTNLTRVTIKPVAMQPSVAGACAPAILPGHSTLVTNREAVIHVYVTPAAEPAMKQSAVSFPLGTVILKQKLATPTAKVPELYTGMLKREKGYNPDCGDWEFFTLSGDAKSVTSRGRIESCMDCHKRYPSSDFVTKRYP